MGGRKVVGGTLILHLRRAHLPSVTAPTINLFFLFSWPLRSYEGLCVKKYIVNVCTNEPVVEGLFCF